MHDACRREKNRGEVARKGKRAFDRQPGPFDVLRVADNRNPGNLQSAADGAFDCCAVCLLLRSVVHLDSPSVSDSKSALPMRFASISFSRANIRIAISPMTK